LYKRFLDDPKRFVPFPEPFGQVVKLLQTLFAMAG
jgi:hypothetical protein